MNAIVRKTLIFVAIVAFIAVGGAFGRKAYKRATERRLVSEAKVYLKKKDLRQAALCLERALQVNPFSLEAAKSMADMLDLVGVPDALNWRLRALRLSPKDPQLRFAVAETALKVRDFHTVTAALESVPAEAKSTPAYYKLAGALAWETGHPGEAEKCYLQAQKLEPANQTIAFNLATIHLTSTNDTIANKARISLEQMSTKAEFRLRALHYLKADAATRKDFPRALGYSRELVRDPAAMLSDKIDHLQLLRVCKSPDFDSWRSGLESEARHSPHTAFAFGQWLNTVQGPADALRWLNTLPSTLQTNPPVPLIIADCHLFLRDWPGLLALLQKQNWGEGEYFRYALQAMAQRAQDQTIPSQASWTKAAGLAANHLDRLTRLTRLSAEWGWSDEHTDLLRTIISEFPDARWAQDALMSELYSSGNSRGLEQFLTDSYQADPNNARLKNNLADISLLRKSGLQTAYRLAQEAYDSSPDNPFFKSTYAYALLLQKKDADAEKIACEIKPEYLKIPSIAAYYGVIQAETGHKGEAREALQRAEAGHLLPEEKEMVRTALARL